MLLVMLQFLLLIQQSAIQNLNILGSFSYPKKTVKIDRTLSRIKVWRKWFSLVGQAYNRSFLKSDKTNKNAEQMTTEGPAAVS